MLLKNLLPSGEINCVFLSKMNFTDSLFLDYWKYRKIEKKITMFFLSPRVEMEYVFEN